MPRTTGHEPEPLRSVYNGAGAARDLRQSHPLAAIWKMNLDKYELNTLKLFKLPTDEFFHLFCRTPLDHFQYMSEIRARIRRLLNYWETEESRSPGVFKAYLGDVLSRMQVENTSPRFNPDWYVPDDPQQVQRMRLILMILLSRSFPKSDVEELVHVGFYFWNVMYHLVVHMPTEVAQELSTYQVPDKKGADPIKATTRRITEMLQTFRVY